MLDLLKTYVNAYRYSEEGATAVEYGIMVALIAVVIIGAVAAVGDGLTGLFNEVATNVGGTAAS